MSRDLDGIGDGVRRTLARLGLRDVDLMLRLRDDWDELAGAPWAGHTRPLGVTDGELRVEAAEPGLVATLRYAAPALARDLRVALGTERITKVRVVAPGRSGPPVR